jgi:hypothetical protein
MREDGCGSTDTRSANFSAYQYGGDASASERLPVGRVPTLGAKQRSTTVSAQPGYASDAARRN